MVELKNIQFQYAEAKRNGMLTDINITIQTGELILLCGKSGSGKTTITRLINGLIPNYYKGELDGEILIDGKDVTKVSLYETSKKVGSVFQNPRSQFFTVDTTSEMAFGCENQGLKENEIMERLRCTIYNFKIEELVGRNIFALSGGEKQKIACASVSASDPEIIVLDEPSSNLDISATKELRKMIKVWKKQGKTIIIAEHRLYYLLGLTDRILYLDEGRLAKEFIENDLLSMSVSQIEELGLRPFDMTKLKRYGIDNGKKKKEIQLSKFCFSYENGKEVLSINSLSLPENEVIAVIGCNGAGKSTFSRCLCGLEQKCNGLILIDGKSYNRKQRLKKCYLVMQDVNHQLFTESVSEELAISMEAENDEIIDKTLIDLNLLGFKENHPMSLSGGQKQRVAIATALISERDILVFDEPTSGLDIQHMKEVANCFSTLKSKCKTVLVITHDFELILQSCTYILHLELGGVKEQYPLNDEGVAKLRKIFFGE